MNFVQIVTQFAQISYEFRTNLPHFPLFPTCTRFFNTFFDHVLADSLPSLPPCIPAPMLLPTLWRSTMPCHQLEEATHQLGALAVEDVVAWAASLDPSPEVIHIDL